MEPSPFTVLFTASGEEDLERLDKAVRERVLRKVEWLMRHTEAPAEALAGEFAGLFKLRVGAYRVIYSRDISQRRLVVHAIGHRRDVYRQ